MPDKTLDVRGQNCPYPLVNTVKSMATLPRGAVLEVQATDPAAIQNISNWAQRTGNQLLEVVTDREDYFIIRLRKGGAGKYAKLGRASGGAKKDAPAQGGGGGGENAPGRGGGP